MSQTHSEEGALIAAPETAGPGPAAPAAARRAAQVSLKTRLISNENLPVLVALAIIWGYFYSVQPIFLSVRNLANLLAQIAVTGTVAVGLTLVLLIGEIDLAVAATAGVAAATTAVLLSNHGWPWYAAVPAGLGVSLVVGLVQGMARALLQMPSFVVTLAGLLSLQGVMLEILGSNGSINVFDTHILKLSTSSLSGATSYVVAVLAVIAYAGTDIQTHRSRVKAGLRTGGWSTVITKSAVIAVVSIAVVAFMNTGRGVPMSFVILLLIAAVASFVMKRTPFGRYIYAVGGDAEASRRAGIRVNGIIIAVFALTSLLAGVGGILGASRYASVSFSAFPGGTLLLDAIGAAVIGGTSLFGGRGKIWNAVLGALVIGSLSNGLDLTGRSASVKLIIGGLILAFAVALDSATRRYRQRVGVR